MQTFFSVSPTPTKDKKVLITGANGWIGRNTYEALKDTYHLILVDKTLGEDPSKSNRVGMEGSEYTKLKKIETPICKIDLAAELGKKEFQQLVSLHKPDCIIHLAGLLENQKPSDIESKNKAIHENVLSVCYSEKIPIIAASSIMVMYGAAMADEDIRNAFEKNSEYIPTKKLSVDIPFDNSKENIFQFNPDQCENNIAYIKSKESLELSLSDDHANSSGITRVAVRFGWTGMADPRNLEENSKYTELPIYLAVEDLQSFMKVLTTSVLNNTIKGYKCYAVLSNHPCCWVDITNIKNDLGWEPKINISERFPQQSLPHSF